MVESTSSVRPRMLICSLGAPDGGVAQALALDLAARVPDAAIVVATDAVDLAEGDWPEAVELIRAPRLTAGSALAPSGQTSLVEALLRETVRVFDPHLIVLDQPPDRMAGVLQRALSAARGAEQGGAVALIVTDELADPPGRDAAGLLNGDNTRMLVLGDSLIARPELEAFIAANPAIEVTSCGFPARPAADATPATMRARYDVASGPLVLAIVERIDLFERLVDEWGPRDGVLVAVGSPRLTAEARMRLAEAVGRRTEVRLGSPDDVPNLMAAGEAVVLLGGERMALDAVAARKRPIVVGLIEEHVRSAALAELGLATLIDFGDATPAALRRGIAAEVDALASPPEMIAFDGIRQAGAVLAGMLVREQPYAAPRRQFTFPEQYRAPAVAAPSLFPSETIVTGWDGTRYYAHPGNLIDLDIRTQGGFEIPVQREVSPFLFAGDVVLDCGANIGAHACHLARRVGRDGLVIAVEPTPYLADRLDGNRRLNGLEQMAIVRKAVSSAAGERILFAPEPGAWNLGNASFHVESGPAISVETVTIDELVAEFELTSLKLIKLDIEGHEVDALLGAHHVLQTLRPHVLFEYLEEVWRPAGRTLDDAMRLLMETHGYRLRPIDWQASQQFSMMLAYPPQAARRP